VSLALLIALMAARPSAPTDLPSLRRSFLDGDLVALDRGRVILRDRGELSDLGPLGLLGDLSRLVRCLPLGPISSEESDRYRAARMLVRLERIRLEQLARDSMHRGTSLEALLLRPSLYRTEVQEDPRFVRWPVEKEVWPGEVADVSPAQPACAKVPGERKEKGDAHEKNRKLRAQADREAITALLKEVEHLPGEAAGRIALAYLDAADAAGERFVLETVWLALLERAVDRALPPERTAARLKLARSFEKNGELARAKEHYGKLVVDPSRTPEEDSRARVRWVALLEPEWEGVLAAVTGAKPRPLDRAALANAEARALFALGRREELMTFGRRWLRDQQPDDKLDRQTADLLLRLGLQLRAPEAMAWIEEITPADEKSQRNALATLADLAVAEKQHELAVAIYDRLRLEAAAARERLGPRAAKLQARWLRARAAVEYERRDVAAFAGFVDDILALASLEEDRPLARYAPHREVAQLCQDLMGRLTNDASTDPERRKFAALLLEAVTGLRKKPGQYRQQLARYVRPLTAIAGEYANGRTARQPKERRVRQLGEIVIPRLPPRLDPPDHATPLPAIDSFLVYEAEDGTWRAGAPWAELLAKRRTE
jgi:hypothetical protein